MQRVQESLDKTLSYPRPISEYAMIGHAEKWIKEFEILGN